MRYSQNSTHFYLPLLSIWEIAHRWHGIDPEGDETKTVLSEVRETLRQLLLAINLYLNPYDGNDQEIPVEELWFTGIRKTKFSKQLEQCMNQRTYEKSFLNSVFIRKSELPKWCAGGGIPLPAFWFQTEEVDEVAEAVEVPETPKNETKPHPPGKRAKAKAQWEEVRSFARAFWQQDPSVSIEDMARKLLKLPNLKIPSRQPDTIKRHITDLAPKGIRGKPGRKPKQSA